jgi:hypothetical protein
MISADLRKVGSISLLDLDIISRFYGRDFLPYPFVMVQPSKFSSYDDHLEYARSVPDRYNNGDLRMFRECARLYANADIRVECHVQYIPADTPSVRLVAYRHEQTGFLAKQQPDDDIIDIYELSPYLLGPAVADAVELKKPGRRSAIIIPEYVRAAGNTGVDAEAAEDVAIRHTVEAAPDTTKLPSTEVTAYSTVQTHWRPTRSWGFDPRKNAAVWVRIKDDGDYLYQPDFSAATPVTTTVLAKRIDQLISEDVKAIRRFRGG